MANVLAFSHEKPSRIKRLLAEQDHYESWGNLRRRKCAVCSNAGLKKINWCCITEKHISIPGFFITKDTQHTVKTMSILCFFHVFNSHLRKKEKRSAVFWNNGQFTQYAKQIKETKIVLIIPLVSLRPEKRPMST